MTKTVPMKGISAAKVSKNFVNAWVFNNGPPEKLISDNGGCFTAKYFRDVCKLLNVKNSYNTSYHPQTNGKVEIYNRPVLAALRTYIADHPRYWYLYTDALAYARNKYGNGSMQPSAFKSTWNHRLRTNANEVVDTKGLQTHNRNTGCRKCFPTRRNGLKPLQCDINAIMTAASVAKENGLKKVTTCFSAWSVRTQRIAATS